MFLMGVFKMYRCFCNGGDPSAGNQCLGAYALVGLIVILTGITILLEGCA